MKTKQIYKQLSKRQNINSIEIKKMIFTSIKNNNHIINNKRAYAFCRLIKLKRYKTKGHIETCILSGKNRGVYSFCHLSRHKINELNKAGNVLNIKTSS